MRRAITTAAITASLFILGAAPAMADINWIPT